MVPSGEMAGRAAGIEIRIRAPAGVGSCHVSSRPTNRSSDPGVGAGEGGRRNRRETHRQFPLVALPCAVGLCCPPLSRIGSLPTQMLRGGGGAMSKTSKAIVKCMTAVAAVLTSTMGLAAVAAAAVADTSVRKRQALGPGLPTCSGSGTACPCSTPTSICGTATKAIRAFWSGKVVHQGGPSDVHSWWTLKRLPGWQSLAGCGAAAARGAAASRHARSRSLRSPAS